MNKSRKISAKSRAHFLRKHTDNTNTETNLFELVEDSVGVGEVPVEEELVNDLEVVARLGEAAGEDLLDVALGLLLDQPPEPGEEPGLAGTAPEPPGVSGPPAQN